MNDIVSIVSADSYIQSQRVIDETIENLGGLDKYVNFGETIVIKPNLLHKAVPDQATTTHPMLMEALAIRLVEFGCKVIIADSPAGAYSYEKVMPIYKATGMVDACNNANEKTKLDNVSLNNDFGYSTIDYDGVVTKRFDIIDVISKADGIINFAKFKTHSFTGYSGAVKNLFGTISGRIKIEMHAIYKRLDVFCDMLIDLEQCLKDKVRLHFIDAIVGMEGPGPSAGSPKFLGVVIASENPYKADIAGLKLIGATKESMPLIYSAIDRKIIDNLEIETVGQNIEDVKCDKFDKIPVDLHEPFSARLPKFIRPIVYKLFTKYPKLKSKKTCVGCEICLKHCPVKAITMIKSKAKFELNTCIRCYCCQELCPHKAIEIKTPVGHKFMRK